MCVKCKHKVFYDPDKNLLYYMDEGCNKLPVPAGVLGGGTGGSTVPIGGGVPDLPPLDPDEVPSAGVACFKANGLWVLLKRFTDAAISVITDVGNFDSSYAEMGRNFPDLKMNNWTAIQFFSKWNDSDAPALVDAWEEHEEAIKEAFLCSLQDKFDKHGRLSDGEYTFAVNHDFDSPSGVLDDFLTDLMEVIEKKQMQEHAAYYAKMEQGECDCVGDSPTPPPPDVPEGFTKILWVGAPSHFAPESPESHPTPQVIFDANFPGALQTGAQSWESKIGSNGSNHALSLMFYFSHPGARITNYKYTLAWEGSTSSITIHINISRSALISQNWTQLFERDNLPASDIVVPVNDEIPGIASGHYLWINYHILGDPAGKKLVLSNVRFDVAADDGAWTRLNVTPGQLIQL